MALYVPTQAYPLGRGGALRHAAVRPRVSGGGGGGGASPLLTGLVAYWKLDEASGDRLDSSSGLVLAEQGGAVGSAAGHLGNAAIFAEDSGGYLGSASTPMLLLGQTSFTVTAWVRVTGDLTQFQNGFVAASGLTTDQAWRLWTRNTAAGSNPLVPAFDVTSAGDSGGSGVNATTFGALTPNTWTFLAAGWDKESEQLWISVNGGARDTAAWAADTGDGAGGIFQPADQSLLVGTAIFGPAINGDVDAVGLWSRVLTSDERAALYAGGAGDESWLP